MIAESSGLFLFELRQYSYAKYLTVLLNYVIIQAWK
jgi:hypothetical protein